MMYGEGALLAFDLHHVLDYICSKLNPERAAKEEKFSQIAYETRKMHPLVRTGVMRDRMREHGEKAETVGEVPRSIIVRDLFGFMERVNVHPTVQSFITQNLHEILDDLSNYCVSKRFNNSGSMHIGEELPLDNRDTALSLDEAEELLGKRRRKRAIWFMR